MQSYDEDLIPLFDPQDLVRTTTTLQGHSNRRKLNQYIRGEKIGKGKHGDVYICEDEAGGYDLVCFSFFSTRLCLNNISQAVKAIRRTNPRDKIKLLRKNYQQSEGQDGAPIMSSTINNIRKEIAIMKKCRHMNLVRLVEVIDDPQSEKIYMGE